MRERERDGGGSGGGGGGSRKDHGKCSRKKNTGQEQYTTVQKFLRKWFSSGTNTCKEDR